MKFKEIELYKKKLKIIDFGYCYDYFIKLNENKLELECFDVVQSFENKNKILLDLGGYYGSIPLISNNYKLVYTFEADPFAVNILKKNLLLNCITNVDKEEIKYFGGYRKFGTSGTHIVDSKDIKKNFKYIQKKTNTLTNIIAEKNIDVNEIALIKMDIEGSEVAVIRDIKDLLNNKKIPLYISIHKHLISLDDFNYLVKMLFEIYQFCYIKKEKFVLVDKDYVISNYTEMFLFIDKELF